MCVSTPSPVRLSPAVFCVSCCLLTCSTWRAVPGSKAVATSKPAGAIAAPWKGEREIRGGSIKGRGGVWIGEGSRCKTALQSRGWGWRAAAMSCGARQDLSCAKGRSPFLWLKQVLECVCVHVLSPQTCLCCTGSFHRQSWYSPLPCDLQYLFIIYINSCSCCIQGISSKHWASLFSFKSISTNTFDVVFLLLGFLYYSLWLGPFLRS